MPRRRARSCGSAPTLFAITLFLGACDASVIAGDPAAAHGGGLVGSQIDGGAGLLLEPAADGLADELHVVALRWGRLVDVYGVDPANGEPSLVLEGFVADPTEVGEGPDVTLGRDLLGGGERLTIQRPIGTSGFQRELERLEAGLVPLDDAGVSLDVVPRDAALELRFNDLIDPGSIDSRTVGLLVEGAPVPVEVTPSKSHGAIVAGERRSSRLVVALTSSLAAAPDALVTLALTLGSSSSLTNLSGHGLRSSSGGTALLMPFLSGGDQGVLGDSIPPFVVGTLSGQALGVTAGPSPKRFSVDFQFDPVVCAVTPQPGDVLATPGHFAEVLSASAPTPATAISHMRVHLRSGDPATFVPSAGTLRSRWTSSVTAPPECFVTILPLPTQAPAVGAATASVVQLAFSEPMDPASVRALDTFRLAYGQPELPSPLAEHVVGAIQTSPGLREFTFAPALPLRHTAGRAERYNVELSGGPQGVRDLAGNPLGFDLPQTTFLIDPSEATEDTGSVSLSFVSVDEDGDGGSEMRGQMLYDLNAGTVQARPVTRFSAVADPSQPMVGAMLPYTSGLQTPLNPLGAKLMSIWRYCDLGMGLLDESYHNIDVEGLAWAPFGGTVITDHFSQFRMALAHAAYLPDEVTSVALLPMFKQSGLVPTFDTNLSDPTGEPLAVVHDKAKGYLVNPADLFMAPTGTAMMPWPMNRNVPAGQFSYWTWRDTQKLAHGVPSGGGADPWRLNQVLPGVALTGFYPTGQVPTIGLPLLTEYRCYPDASALGLNSFRTAIALGSSYKPTFRAYSAGGISPGGTKLVDPDADPVATGGVNPVTGSATLPIDNSYYYGQADFVVRVSRAHTRWLDTGAPKQDLVAVLERHLPPGTTVQVAYRGASQLGGTGQPWLDAANLDAYGDSYTVDQLSLLGLPLGNAYSVQFYPVATSPEWHDAVADVAGARFVQARFSFISDAVNLAVPSLDGFGLTWSR